MANDITNTITFRGNNSLLKVVGEMQRRMDDWPKREIDPYRTQAVPQLFFGRSSVESVLVGGEAVTVLGSKWVYPSGTQVGLDCQIRLISAWGPPGETLRQITRCLAKVDPLVVLRCDWEDEDSSSSGIWIFAWQKNKVADWSHEFKRPPAGEEMDAAWKRLVKRITKEISQYADLL